MQSKSARQGAVGTGLGRPCAPAAAAAAAAAARPAPAPTPTCALPAPTATPAARSTSATADDGDDRGIYFIAFMADLERQFEFIQANWANTGDGVNAGSDRDVFIGRAPGR